MCYVGARLRARARRSLAGIYPVSDVLGYVTCSNLYWIEAPAFCSATVIPFEVMLRTSTTPASVPTIRFGFAEDPTHIVGDAPKEFTEVAR